MTTENPVPVFVDRSAFSKRQFTFLVTLYRFRPCAICGHKTWCMHREPLVDLGEHHHVRNVSATSRPAD